MEKTFISVEIKYREQNGRPDHEEIEKRIKNIDKWIKFESALEGLKDFIQELRGNN